MVEPRPDQLALQDRIERFLENSQIDRSVLEKLSIQELAEEVSIYHQELVHQNEELLRRGAALEQANHRYQELYQDAPIGYVVTDADQKIISANRAFWRLLAPDAPLQPGQNLAALIHPEDQDAFYFSMRELERRGYSELPELRLVHRSRVVYTHCSCNAFSDEGQQHVRLAFIDISGRKQDQQRVAEALELNRTIIQSAPLGILTFKASGECVTANEAAGQILGAPLSVLLQGNFHEIPIWKQNGLYVAALRTLETGQPASLVVHGANAAGKEVWLNAAFAAFTSGGEPHLLHMFADDTERQQIQAALQASEQRFATVFHDGHDAISISRLADGVHLDVNDAYLATYELSREQVIGCTPFDFNLWQHSEQMELVQSLLKERKVADFEMRYRTASGREGFVEVSASVTTIGGEECVISFSREITARKLAEAELQAAHTELEQRVQARTAELRQANQALEKAMRARDEFMAATSHELRTPLAGILGLAEVLFTGAYGDLNEKQQKAIVGIEQSGRRLLDLINEVLDYTQIQSGRLYLRQAPCMLRKVCLASLKAVDARAAVKRQQLDLEIFPLEIELRADELRLRQILVNLLENAVKFTPEGGHIGLSAIGGGGQVTIRVTDSGIGIRAEDFPRLFQPFVQLDAGLARNYEGTGLGLVLVKALTELHGGRVEVTSTPGLGSTFTIILPWSAESQAPVAPQAPAEPEA